MSDTALRLTKHFSGAGIALAFVLGMAIPAQARGIVADDGSGLQTNPGCALSAGTSCAAAVTFTDASNTYSIYLYTDGLVTIGSQLPSTTIDAITGPNGLSNIASMLGNAPFVAVGLNDYSSLNLGMSPLVDVQFKPDELTLEWVFQAPGQTKAVFALQIDDFDLAGLMELTAGYGAQDGSWFDASQNNPYCDPDCGPPSGDGIKGVYLPPDSLIGSDMNGTAYTAYTNAFADPSFDYSNILFSPTDLSSVVPAPTTVPEPAAWSIMGFGLLAMCFAAGQSRRRRAARARS